MKSVFVVLCAALAATFGTVQAATVLTGVADTAMHASFRAD